MTKREEYRDNVLKHKKWYGQPHPNATHRRASSSSVAKLFARRSSSLVPALVRYEPCGTMRCEA
jgi:hypothetical protein